MRQSFRRQNSHHRSVRFCSYPTGAHFTGAKGNRVSFCDIDFGPLRCVHRDRPDRGWDHALRAILRGQQSDMVNAIEQGLDGPHGARILDGGKRASNCFTVIQSTSTAGTSESRKRTHRRCRACFSKCSARGYCASSSRRTTSVTESPRYAKQRRLFRRRRPRREPRVPLGHSSAFFSFVELDRIHLMRQSWGQKSTFCSRTLQCQGWRVPFHTQSA